MTTYRYSGTWKTTGFIKGNTKWHSGQIVIACDVSGFWRCSLGFSEKKPVSRDILLSGKKGHKIKNVHTKNRLQINLEDGTTIHVGDLHKDQLSEVGTLLMEIQNGKLPDRGFGRKLTPPKASVPCGHQSLVPSQTSPASKVLSASPRHVTGSVTHSTPMMKDSHSERHENLFALSDTEVEDFKENKFDRTPSSQRKTGKRFLEISQEKSRDTLAHLSTSGFYGNKTGNMQGPVGIISGIKRRPGLMPQFPERKKLCISNSPSSGYTWQRKTVLTPSNDRQTSLHGFSNLGNTCYMNAILQSLFALETFTADLWTLSRRVKNLLPYDQMQGKLYNCLTKLLVMKWRPNVTTDQHRICLASVKRAISATAKRFSGQNQHDAHEFLSQVVDQLKEEVIKISKDLHSPNKHAADNHQAAARDGVTDGTTEESLGILNPTSQNFEFEVRHIIRCLKHEVTKEESFHDLSLDMPCQRDTFSTASLQDALDQFLRKELIDYTCAECQHKKAEVTHKFVKLPRILVLHLKRYCFNAVTSSHTKTGRPISIARYLTLERHCVEDTTPAYPAPEPCSPTEFRPKPANDTGAAKARESTPQHRGGFSFHRPFLSLPHTLELEEEGTQGRNDTGKKVTLDKEENPKDVTHMDEDDQMKCLMEMSEKEPEPAKSKTPDLSDFNPESLTEEQMLQMAVEQSMQDSHLNNGRHDNRTPWRNSHQDASSPGSDTHCDTKLETSNGVLTNTNSGCRYDSNRSVNHDDSDKKVTVCQQCGANCYFVSSIGKYLCDCVTNSSDHRKQKLNVGDTPRSVSRTPRKLDFVSMENYCEPCPGDTAASGPCPDVTDPCSGRLMDSDSRVSGRRCDVLGEADCQDADFNHLVEMADLDDDVCSLGTQSHHYTETDMAQWNEQHNSSVNNGPSLVLDLTGEEEDKENKTPPPRDISAASMKDEPDWLSKTKESEERDFLLAVENSLRDQELAEQEQLSAITQQSLRECEKKEDVMSDEENMFIVEDPEDEEKREALLRNVETGELGYSYQLMSVVSHLGSSSSLGHYVSDVYDIKQQRWYSYNDSDVTRTSEDIVRKSRERCGYIFFYLSKEIEEDLRDWFAEKNRESNEGYLHTRPVSR